jgi:hypothetical protein
MSLIGWSRKFEQYQAITDVPARYAQCPAGAIGSVFEGFLLHPAKIKHNNVKTIFIYIYNVASHTRRSRRCVG